MPVEKLSQDDKLDLENFYYYAYDNEPDNREVKEWIKDLNHFFAKIYSYKRTGRPKSRARGSRANPKKRTLSAWNKFVKANSNKKKFQFRDGKLKLKQMGIAYRKTRAYKQNRRK